MYILNFFLTRERQMRASKLSRRFTLETAGKISVSNFCTLVQSWLTANQTMIFFSSSERRSKCWLRSRRIPLKVAVLCWRNSVRSPSNRSLMEVMTIFNARGLLL